jgi:hypothetical protein
MHCFSLLHSSQLQLLYKEVVCHQPEGPCSPLGPDGPEGPGAPVEPGGPPGPVDPDGPAAPEKDKHLQRT